MTDLSTRDAEPATRTKAAEGERKVERSASLYVLALRKDLLGKPKHLGAFSIGDYTAEVVQGADSLWLLVRREGRGGLAIRAAYAPGGFSKVTKARAHPGEVLRLEATSALGHHRVGFKASGAGLHRLRLTASLIPAEPLLIPFAPRDLYPLGENDDPLAATGRVEAAQRGPNSGLVYLTMDQPAFGHVLYFQYLSSLNPYFRATGTTPMGAVGGEWPELGYLPPAPRRAARLPCTRCRPAKR